MRGPSGPVSKCTWTNATCPRNLGPLLAESEDAVAATPPVRDVREAGAAEVLVAAQARDARTAALAPPDAPGIHDPDLALEIGVDTRQGPDRQVVRCLLDAELGDGRLGLGRFVVLPHIDEAGLDFHDARALPGRAVQLHPRVDVVAPRRAERVGGGHAVVERQREAALDEGARRRGGLLREERTLEERGDFGRLTDEALRLIGGNAIARQMPNDRGHELTLLTAAHGGHERSPSWLSFHSCRIAEIESFYQRTRESRPSFCQF